MNNASLMSENINELICALSKAQGLMSGASKDSSNPFFNSKYADLNSIWNACREALSQHGLAVIQTTNRDQDGELYLSTLLAHSSGQWIRSDLPIKIKVPETPETDKFGKPKKVNELQLLGSCLTYLRRYALAAIVGVAPDEDDDGNSGAGYQARTQKKEADRPKQEAIQESKNAPVLKTISDVQAAELEMILDDCDKSYKDLVYKVIKKQHQAESLSQVPIEIYPRMKEAAIKNMEEHRAKQMANVQPDFVLEDVK